MSSAAATACTRTPRCRLRRTAASLNSELYSWTFFGPARGTRHLPLLGGSVYKSEAGSPASFKRLLGRRRRIRTPLDDPTTPSLGLLHEVWEVFIESPNNRKLAHTAI